MKALKYGITSILSAGGRMRRREVSIAEQMGLDRVKRSLGVGLLMLALITGGCDEPTSAADERDAAERTDTTSIDAMLPVDVRLSADTDASSQADVAEADVAEPPMVQPAPSRYDCSAVNTELPARRSPVPIDCIQDPSCQARIVVGHRGTGGGHGMIAPENSRAAIRAAVWMGVDGIELDVRVTSDEVLVLMHDSTIDRTTEGVGEVSAMTAAELRAIVLRPGDDVVLGDFGCETVPTLEEALGLARDRVVLHLDAKTARVDLIALAIERAGMLDQVFISTGDDESAQLARETVPAVMIQVRPDDDMAIAAVRQRFADTRLPEIFELPASLTPSAAAALQADGVKVLTNAWPEDASALLLDDLDPYLDLYERGADLLQSEFPGLVLQALERNRSAAP